VKCAVFRVERDRSPVAARPQYFSYGNPGTLALRYSGRCDPYEERIARRRLEGKPRLAYRVGFDNGVASPGIKPIDH
jgi:hypothetical protein